MDAMQTQPDVYGPFDSNAALAECVVKMTPEQRAQYFADCPDIKQRLKDWADKVLAMFGPNAYPVGPDPGGG